MDAQLLSLLAEARRYLDDPRLSRDELSGRRRLESQQDHADRLSSWIQENEDLRTLCERIDALLDPSTHVA